jgi:hypothetical protein
LGQLRRREFITLISGAVAWPLATAAQQFVPVIGLLHSASAEDNRTIWQWLQRRFTRCLCL